MAEPRPYAKRKRTKCGVSMKNEETIVAQVEFKSTYISCKRCLRTIGLTT